PARAEIDSKAAAHFECVRGERVEPVKARVAILARSLHDIVELSDQEISESVTGERCARRKSEAAIGTEVVGDVAEAPAVLAAEAELMAPARPAHDVAGLVFIAQEAIGIPCVERAPVAAGGNVPLRLVVIRDLDSEIGEALGRIDGHIVAVRAVEAEQRLV